MTELLAESFEVKRSFVAAIEGAYNFWDWWEGSDVDRATPPSEVDLQAARKVTGSKLSPWALEHVDTIAEGTRLTLGTDGEEVLHAALAELAYDDGASENLAVRERLLGDMVEGGERDSLTSDQREAYENNLNVVFDLARIVLDAPLRHVDMTHNIDKIIK